MTPDCPVHRLVHRCRRFDAEISFVPVDRFSRFREVNTTVMQRRGRCCHPSDQLPLLVDEGVKFIPELTLFPFLRPGAVPAPPGPCLIAAGRISGRMTGIGGNERCILDHTPVNFQAAGIELLLEVGPEVVDHAGVDQPVLERSDRRTVRDRGRIPKKMAE